MSIHISWAYFWVLKLPRFLKCSWDFAIVGSLVMICDIFLQCKIITFDGVTVAYRCSHFCELKEWWSEEVMRKVISPMCQDFKQIRRFACNCITSFIFWCQLCLLVCMFCLSDRPKTTDDKKSSVISDIFGEDSKPKPRPATTEQPRKPAKKFDFGGKVSLSSSEFK